MNSKNAMNRAASKSKFLSVMIKKLSMCLRLGAILFIFPATLLRLSAESYSLTGTVDPPGGGAIFGTGTYPSNAQASVTIIASPGWRIQALVVEPRYRNGVSLSDDLVIDFIMNNTQECAERGDGCRTNISGAVWMWTNKLVSASFSRDPGISTQPSNQVATVGSSVIFTVVASASSPINYQWQKNSTNLVDGGNLFGATTNTLTITGISDNDAASYSVIVSNLNGSVISSNAVLTVDDSLFIATQPLSQTVGVGSNVTFNVTVYGAPPFIFQWYYNNSPAGSPTSGTNVSSYTLTNVQTNQSGNYSVEVFNGSGSLMSSNAVLTVQQVFPPSIGIQPSSQTVMIGNNVSFNVSVGGTAPFRYQWRFNSANILNATNATYAIPAVVATNTGNYSVIVTNSAGSVTSSNALLTVIVPPTLALQFSAGYPIVKLYGMLSSNFVVQYNTNLVNTNWINLRSLTNLSVSPYQFLDPAGGDQPARFYRAFMQ